MNWRAGEGYIQRNTLEEKHDEIQRLNTANFEWQFSKCREATWDNTLAISRGQEREEGKKKRKRKKKKKKERSEERWQQYTLFPFFFFPLPFLILFFSWSSLPFSLSKRQERERERVRRKKGEEEGKKRKGKRVYCCHLPLLSFFLLFIFPSLLSFFLSSLSLASLTRQAWCHMSFFKHSEAVSQKW